MKSKKFDIQKLNVLSKDECFICKHDIAKENIIYEDKKFIAFLDQFPPTKGYTILAFKKHYEDITEIPLKDYLEFQKVLHSLCKSIKKSFKPIRICLQNSGGFLAHFHFHIIPMYVPVKDNFIDVILKKNVLELSLKERKEIAQTIANNI